MKIHTYIMNIRWCSENGEFSTNFPTNVFFRHEPKKIEQLSSFKIPV